MNFFLSVSYIGGNSITYKTKEVNYREDTAKESCFEKQDKSPSINFYTITLPSGEKKKLYYPYNGDPKRRTLQLETIFSEPTVEYCNDNWITFGSKSGFGDSEEKVKRFLEGCANFLLAKGSTAKSTHLTKEDLHKIFDNEIHLDSYLDEEYINADLDLESTLDLIEGHGKELHGEDNKILYSRNQREQLAKDNSKRIKTQFDKYNDLFGNDEKIIHTYKNVSKSFKPDTWIPEKRNLRSKVGLIDRNEPYKSGWCTLNTLNQFEFDGEYFEFVEEVSGYEKQWRNSRYDDFRNDYKWDKVLVFSQFDKMYFFDQDIERIPNHKIGYMDI